ncbi:hypothetical protein TNCV_1352871 [Trichonephila clavipes]|nr:hypothetical protein TNCV_1352871 [Trichonephila clavipes]
MLNPCFLPLVPGGVFYQIEVQPSHIALTPVWYSRLRINDRRTIKPLAMINFVGFLSGHLLPQSGSISSNDSAVGSLVVRAPTPDWKAWVRCSMPPNTL